MKSCNDPASDTITIETASPEQTEQLGYRLGKLLQPGDLLLLSGTLGAGKTCLTRGLAQGWGAQQQPTSPTFTLINEYDRPAVGLDERFYHVDCYRLSGSEDALTTGIQDLFGQQGVLVIEWPERIEKLIPEDYMWIEIEQGDEDARRFTVYACGERARKLLGSIHD